MYGAFAIEKHIYWKTLDISLEILKPPIATHTLKKKKQKQKKNKQTKNKTKKSQTDCTNTLNQMSLY